ncbi:uncharacterized protein LOC124999199 isoform X2 [Mugil cephalus]|uniref:uncharacterized protein LOC124999199 isoform X2 n=1 Tax=Mugil cephalus TaxID=48193 RepID=UPI001FB62EF5|nr:uncharacterized protein LOC124999199 isoform X2 [Mugil cephalus]
MVSVWGSSGALLLVMLIGASHGYPAKKDSGLWAASNPVNLQSASYEEPRYVQREPAAASSPSRFPAPVFTGPGLLTQPAPTQEVTWAISPSLSGEAPSTGSQAFASGAPVGPEYQSGELAHVEEILEHGHYESETEEEGFPSQQASSEAEEPSASFDVPLTYSTEWGSYPYYDYMFLLGQYPPGTVTHFSSSLEQGRDNWHDIHYIRYFYPAGPGLQQVQTFPAQGVKPVPQSSRS